MSNIITLWVLVNKKNYSLYVDITLDKDEKTHILALEAAGISYNLNPCEGVFHGPKLEVNLSKRIKV